MTAHLYRCKRRLTAYMHPPSVGCLAEIVEGTSRYPELVYLRTLPYERKDGVEVTRLLTVTKEELETHFEEVKQP